MLRLSAADALLTIEPERGGRITSLVVAGRELLMWERFRTIDWGSYPMAPFAGRLRDARFMFDGRAIQLPATEGPHAIHGTTLDRPWRIEDDRTISIDLGDPWPFAGRVTQGYELEPGRLRQTMRLDAVDPMPAVIGWHPWFVRRPRLVSEARAGEPEHLTAPLELQFGAERMLQRDADGLPTGHRLSPPPPPPWDDAFEGVVSGPTLRWPGFLELSIESDASHWVVYTHDEDGIAVEPQTGPPDGPNLEPRVVVPGTPLTIEMTWRWRDLTG